MWQRRAALSLPTSLALATGTRPADGVALYNAALTANQVRNHFSAAGLLAGGLEIDASDVILAKRVLDPATVARLLQARDHLQAAAATLHPARWEALYAPQLRILEDDILVPVFGTARFGLKGKPS